MRMYFEPNDVFRQRRVVDDFVGDFERQPGEEVEAVQVGQNVVGDLATDRHTASLPHDLTWSS